MPLSGEYFRAEYSVDEVRWLLGLHRNSGGILDLLSAAQDPGGLGRRGSFTPDSEWATTFWDLMRAIAALELREQAVIALIAFGFSIRDVARLVGLPTRDVSKFVWGNAQHVGIADRITASMNGQRPAGEVRP